MGQNRNNTAMNKLKSFFLKRQVSKAMVITVFALFFLCGGFIFRDYGISPDEDTERRTSLINYIHVMGPAMRSSENEAVRAIAAAAPELAAYDDRYYGTALQSVTVAIEHLYGFQLATQDIYLMRHAFVFLNYFAAGICFYLIIRRRFGGAVLPLLGALAFMLYPRFFGEAFYNIKDNLFFSWMVISGYFVLRWLEERKTRDYFFAAAALALTVNTRILGASPLLLACAFAVIISIRNKEAFLRAAGRPFALFALTVAFWILVTPFLWENPLKNMAETFRFFLSVVEWDNLHLYMGEMITRHVPWHYLPVWMGITIPIPYILMSFAGFAAIGVRAFGAKRHGADSGGSIRAGHPRARLYDLFMAALFVCTLLGYIILGISMYDGWRHAYGIYFPFLYIAVVGLASAIAFVSKKHIMLRRIGAAAVFACFAFLFGWIIVNHPYQYVYFNSVGRLVAEPNFTMDYWQISNVDLLRHALASDSRPQIAVFGFSFHSIILTDSENSRIIWVENPFIADYVLQDTRWPYDQSVPPEGFEEYASIIVDGMKISTIYRNHDYIK